ncbi:MAG: nucleotidyltransferase family protein, partial [Alistipes sp.]|nr:nucleotidyltransferase family protein [Alistipes sp.]
LAYIYMNCLILSGSIFMYYTFYNNHDIVAIVWDNIQHAMSCGQIQMDQQPSKAERIQWALATEQVERKYARQKAVIAKLSGFFAEHGIKMMILKGYVLSLNYPVPNHRPCSDVDIWLFEERQASDGKTEKHSAQQKADNLLREHFNIEIDEGKHHHTVFYVDGVMVENHYDFLNIHAHRSNRVIEARLHALTQQDMEAVEVEGTIVYLPSPDFHALFMLRHSASHFAAERIVIRHLLDWRYFVEKYTSKIDWQSLYEIAEQMNMHRFLNCMNAVCIDKLGLPSGAVPEFKRDQMLEERVWNEILQPEFAEAKPLDAGYIKSWGYMFRRWWANRWKHKLVYSEGLATTFIVQVWSHLLKPKSLKVH